MPFRQAQVCGFGPGAVGFCHWFCKFFKFSWFSLGFEMFSWFSNFFLFGFASVLPFFGVLLVFSKVFQSDFWVLPVFSKSKLFQSLFCCCQCFLSLSYFNVFGFACVF